MPLKTQNNPLLPRLPESEEDQGRFNEDLLEYLRRQSGELRSDLEGVSGGGTGYVPVGGFIDFYQNPAGTLTIPDEFAEGNGTRVDDADSTWDGYRTPNVNGADVVLTLTWTADGGGSYATVPAVDVTALFPGDSVSGTGIASGTTISDITGTTVTISDTDATGEIETTFTNDGRFVRGSTSSGDGDIDRMQRIEGYIRDLPQVSGNFGSDSTGDGVFNFSDTASARAISRSNSSYSGTYEKLNFDSADSTSPNTAKTSDTETAPIYFTIIKIMRKK